MLMHITLSSHMPVGDHHPLWRHTCANLNPLFCNIIFLQMLITFIHEKIPPRSSEQCGRLLFKCSLLPGDPLISDDYEDGDCYDDYDDCDDCDDCGDCDGSDDCDDEIISLVINQLINHIQM